MQQIPSFVCVYYCYSSSNQTTRQSADSSFAPDSDSKSKPWLSRVFANEKAAATEGDQKPVDYFDMREVRDMQGNFNKPAGIRDISPKYNFGRKIR